MTQGFPKLPSLAKKKGSTVAKPRQGIVKKPKKAKAIADIRLRKKLDSASIKRTEGAMVGKAKSGGDLEAVKLLKPDPIVLATGHAARNRRMQLKKKIQ